jgi:hypothetical protein
VKLKRQYKHQVIAEVRKNGTWSGLVTPCKQYPIIGRTAVELSLYWEDDQACVVSQTVYDHNMRAIPRTFDQWLLRWEFHNGSREEGYYAAYYTQEG